MTSKERNLLETTARSLLKLEREILPRIAGIEMIIKAVFLAKGNMALALARLRIQADLLEMKGTPSSYLNSFVEVMSADSERPD
jgi:hypothetical protein